MSDGATPDLAFIGRQLKIIVSELGSLRDDVTVLTAVAMRQDGTLNALLTELRVMHSQHSRLATRVRTLEAASEEKL